MLLSMIEGPRALIESIDRQRAPARPVANVNALRCEWRRLARRLSEGDVELDVDTVTAVIAAHDRLVAAGGTVDVMAEALVTQLRLQLADVEAFSG